MALGQKNGRRAAARIKPGNGLGSHASVVAIGTIHRCHVAKVNGVFEGGSLRCSADLLSTDCLGDHGMAAFAIFADDLPVGTDVVAIVTTEASLRIEMPDIVGMHPPINFHLREDGGLEDSLRFGDCCHDCCVLFIPDFGIFVLIELLQAL